MTEQEIKARTLESPALKHKSERTGKFAYPKKWGNKVPLKVKMLETVHPDMPFLGLTGTVAHQETIHYVWVNSYGAVAAILPNGQFLGLKPDEF